MSRSIAAFSIVFALLMAGPTHPNEPAGDELSPKPPLAQWRLVWSDEFDGTAIDRSKWDFDRGTGYWLAMPNPWGGFWTKGWGNAELQCYTDRRENAYVEEGMLHIRALKESYQGSNYTSARLKTRKNERNVPLFSKKYGRFEFRAKLPVGQGLWPALWLLPEDEKYGPWASSGEIDVVETKGQDPSKVYGTLVYGSRHPKNTFVSKEYALPNRGSIAHFHVYALEWEPGEFRWYVDNQLYATQDFWWSCSQTTAIRKTNDRDGSYVYSVEGVNPVNDTDVNPWPAPFDQPFYILMNVSVGGRFVGDPDRTTVFPHEMVVDFVRVYDKVGGYPATKSRGPGRIPFTTLQRSGGR